MLPVLKQAKRHEILKALLDMLIICNIAFPVVDSFLAQKILQILSPWLDSCLSVGKPLCCCTCFLSPLC